MAKKKTIPSLPTEKVLTPADGVLTPAEQVAPVVVETVKPYKPPCVCSLCQQQKALKIGAPGTII